MAATSLAELYDFEGQFEGAAQNILAAAEIVSFISQQKKQLPLINTGVAFEVGPALNQLTFLPLASGQTNPVEQEYFRYTGTLDLRVEVARDTARSPSTAVDTFLAQIRGMIRGLFMRSQWPFQDSNLPYYRVSDIIPAGTVTGYDSVRNTDAVNLRFTITFAIQPTAWPAGFPPT